MSLDKLRKLKARALSRDGFWVEKIKLEFTKALGFQMKRRNIKKVDLAKQLDLSAAYISKVMRGDENFTIETMVKLARASGGKLHLHISDEDSNVNWIECNGRNSFRELISGFSVDEYDFDSCRTSVVRARPGSGEHGNVAA